MKWRREVNARRRAVHVLRDDDGAEVGRIENTTPERPWYVAYPNGGAGFFRTLADAKRALAKTR